MSASNEWTDWHLTPSGWKRGSEREDGSGVTSRPTPSDRLMTVRHKEYLSSAYSALDKTDEISWQSDDTNAIQNLLKIHGPAPATL